MEGKNVILSVLIMSLVMAQIQVEAKSCCPSTTARNIYNVCRLGGGSRPMCCSLSGCKIVSKCPNGYTHDTLQNSGDAVNEYCKLGCTYSVCAAMETLQSSDASEIVSGAVAQCAKACSTFCAKGSSNVVETA
ncbi:PREDICTED: thionin isoform X3 [Camelina sativa]|uniref:Thionin isoform X2 n=1 Tax=Camelina sativa TaxID=90675 RepID=A0ABM0WF87_CAMSA|nr:PREDICTED: thionin isoform X2 [Camelina sativa]XP_010470236.1 PREDICTED: thionin isoform X3 [Camelina sativa]